MKTCVLNLLLSAMVVATFTATAEASKDSMANVEAAPKLLILQKLEQLLPPYIEATDAVLEGIGQIPKVTDETSLSEISPNLFETQFELLQNSDAFVDTDFGGGREEETVGWLKKSSIELKDLQTVVRQSLAGDNVDAKLDKHLHLTINRSSRNKWGAEVGVILNAVSRFYCNISVVASEENKAKKLSVEASESCD